MGETSQPATPLRNGLSRTQSALLAAWIGVCLTHGVAMAEPTPQAVATGTLTPLEAPRSQSLTKHALPTRYRPTSMMSPEDLLMAPYAPIKGFHARLIEEQALRRLIRHSLSAGGESPVALPVSAPVLAAPKGLPF